MPLFSVRLSCDEYGAASLEAYGLEDGFGYEVSDPHIISDPGIGFTMAEMNVEAESLLVAVNVAVPQLIYKAMQELVANSLTISSV